MPTSKVKTNLFLTFEIAKFFKSAKVSIKYETGVGI